MKQSVRFFAIGLMTSAIIMFAYFAMFDKSTAIDNVPIDDLIAHIEEDDYRVISEEDFISFSLMNKEEVDSEKEAKETEPDQADKKDDEASDKKEADEKEKETQEKKDKDDEKKKKEEEAKKKEKEKDKPKKVTFTTKPGVVTEDVADILYKKKVIDDKQKFQKYLEDNDHSPYIQIGTFEVTTDMSFKELADVVTTYPGN